MSKAAVATTNVFKVKGVAGELEVFEDKLTITPKGVLGFLNKGLKGTKTIPFHSITAIQHKKAGFTSGYLQFTMPGGNESRGGVLSAASDENTFMYSQKSDNALIEQIKEFIEGRVNALRAGQGPRSSGSVADELSKLADLHRQGILSVDEFAQAKKRLIG
jgi:hypothetical protein